MGRKAQEVLMYNENDELIKKFKNAYEASKHSGIARGTIQSQCQHNRKGREEFYFRYSGKGDTISTKAKQIVELNRDGELVRIYESQGEVAKEKGVSRGQINHYLKGRAKSRRYKLMYKKDYDDLYGESKVVEEKPKTEINKPKSKEIYVNVLVGLANATLVDGALYNINGTKLRYSKSENALKLGDTIVYKQEEMFKEVSIELPILNQKERYFLKNLLKAFTNAKGIVKCDDIRKGFEFIRIETYNKIESIDLPPFIEGKYYANLQKDRLYSIEELDIKEVV